MPQPPPPAGGLYGLSAPIEPGLPQPLLAAFPERAKQRRWTVVVRWILAIPLGVVLLVIGIGAFFVAIVGWFGALFTGRLPDFARRYLTRYIKLSLNLSAYVYLLTDTFPPFDAEDVVYPVHMAVPPATRLNRWSVFFRVILVIPAAIVSSVVANGIGVLLFFLWLITLVSGWLPRSAHGAISAFLRYQTRFSAFYLMVVPAYPSRLFGEGGAPQGLGQNAQTPPSTATGATTVPSTPWTVSPASNPLAVPPSPAMPPQPVARQWNLVLSRGARRFLVIAIVLGALGYVGQITAQAVIGAHNYNQTSTLNNAVATLNSSFNHYERNVEDCPKDATQVACVEGAAGTLASQLRSFANNVSGLNVIGVDPSDLDAAVASARTSEADFEKLANAGPTATDYENVAHGLDLQRHLDQLQRDLNVI
jgi:hypothetical protein